MRPLFAVQYFADEKWTTVHVSSFLPDSSETYRALDEMTSDDAPIRLARFMVDDFDFLGTQCRDFAIITRGGV